MAEGKSLVPWIIGGGCGCLTLIGLVFGGLLGYGAYIGNQQEAQYSAPVPAPVLPAPTGPNALPPPLVPAGFRQISAAGCTYSVPEGWVDIDAGPSITKASRATIAANDFYTNANLVQEPFAGDLATYVSANQTAMAAAGIQSVRSAQVGDAYEIESTFASNTPPTRMIQHIRMASGAGKVLTCSGPFADFEPSRPVCMAIVATFRCQ